MDITEKVAYLKGLIEGLGLDDSTKEGKVILAMMELLDDVVLAVSDMEDGIELLSEQMDGLDEDICELQEDFYDDDDEEAYVDFDGELYEVTCPSCNDTICIDEDMLDEGEIDCPNCGETLEFDLDGTIEDCDCGHDHSSK